VGKVIWRVFLAIVILFVYFSGSAFAQSAAPWCAGGSLGSDIDGDGITDDWETDVWTVAEYGAAMNVNSGDTDTDGYSDWLESCVYLTNPVMPYSNPNTPTPTLTPVPPTVTPTPTQTSTPTVTPTPTRTPYVVVYDNTTDPGTWSDDFAGSIFATFIAVVVGRLSGNETRLLFSCILVAVLTGGSWSAVVVVTILSYLPVAMSLVTAFVRR
jgi:hypothetical protein